MDLVANPRNSPFASAVFLKFATESDPLSRKKKLDPSDFKEINIFEII
jgi:hypothetical protein